MDALRRSTTLTLALLAWFVASLVFSTLHTMNQPPGSTMDITVCIGSGGFMTTPVAHHTHTAHHGHDSHHDHEHEHDAPPAGHGHHHGAKCPLCFTVLPPTATLDAPLHHPQPLGRALQPIVAAHLKAITGAPYPPRGPPALA